MKYMVCMLACLAVCGCSSDEQTSEKRDDTSETPEPIVSDDPQAIEALNAIGAKTKKNDDGLITEVNLRQTEADDGTLESISTLEHVRSLLLNDLAITDSGLATLSRVSWPIVNLDLRGCPVSNDGLQQVARLNTLQALRLSGSNSGCSVDDDGMDFVARLSGLRVLSLDKLWISEIGIEKLLVLGDLEELYLAETTIGDDALALLAQLPKLRRLRLSKNQISSEGLKQLTELENLQELDLSEISQLSDDGMQHIGRLTSLRKLNLWRVPITDAGVEHLSSLKNLEWLNLDNTMLTDAGLSALADLQQLTFLHLGSTQISDAGITQLRNLTSLKDLKVTRTAVTSVGVAELQTSLPNTKIQLEYLGN